MTARILKVGCSEWICDILFYKRRFEMSKMEFALGGLGLTVTAFKLPNLPNSNLVYDIDIMRKILYLLNFILKDACDILTVSQNERLGRG